MATTKKETEKKTTVKKTETKTAAKKPAKKCGCKKAEVKEPKVAKKDEKVVVSKASEAKAIYHIMYNDDKKVWSIKKDKAKRIIATFKTKDEAIARAKKLSDSNDVTIMIYKKDGKVQVLTNL